MLVLLLSTVWCVGGYSQEKTLSVDFESSLSTYTDWTFKNITKTNTIKAKTGSYYGNTSGKATAYIQTKNIIEAPGTLKFYISKESSNSKSSNWIIQVSSDATKWTNIKTQSAGSGITSGEWTEVSQDLSSQKNVYVRVYYDGRTAIRCIDDITLTYTSTTGKTPTTTTFGDDIDGKNVTVYKGGSFPAYKATATDKSGNSVEGTYKYTSSNTTCVTVDETTGQTAAGTEFGKADIKVEFTPTDAAYEGSSASYTIDYKDVSVIDPNIVFYESFDKCDGTGGNDGKWSGNIATKDLVPKMFDENEWMNHGKVYGANKCIRIGTSDVVGSVTTKKISYAGDAVLTFKAGAWDKKKTSGAVVVTITNGNLSYNGKKATSQTIDIPNAAFGEFTMNIVGASEEMTLKFANATSKDNQFFLDEVKITATKSEQAESVTLTEGNNDEVILAAASAGKPCNVTLERTMNADGGWYTFCVPFDIENIATTPLKDAEIRKYSSMLGSVMNFEETKSLKAVHAYLVKPKVDIVNPVFENVMVSLGDDLKDGDNGYFFEGIYSEKELLIDGTNLFLGADNKFYIPTETGNKMKALRGYFVAPLGVSGSKMGINIDGETNYITTLNGSAVVSGKVYNLNGQYVGNDIKSLKKGVYVVNGRKFIVK